MTPFGYLIVDLNIEANPETARHSSSEWAAAARYAARKSVRWPRPAGRGSLTDGIADAGITPDEVALVIVKTPLVSHEPSPVPGAPSRSAYAKAVGALVLRSRWVRCPATSLSRGLRP